MQRTTRLLWADQNLHPGDRQRLFATVSEAAPIRTVLYPGSFVDVAASFVFDDVTYVDNDARAAQFFADADGVNEIIGSHRSTPGAQWRFLVSDYRIDLGLPEESFDLLVSLYAGFVSEHCTQHLRIGGLLAVNPSHGDVAMASIDGRYELAAAVGRTHSGYRLITSDLDSFLVPQRDVEVTTDMLHVRGRAVGYSKTSFAYLFRRIA